MNNDDQIEVESVENRFVKSNQCNATYNIQHRKNEKKNYDYDVK